MFNKSNEFLSLDDLLHATYKEIIENGKVVLGKRGSFKEIMNYSATLQNPRIRTSMSLDRKLVKSKFAEFSWYLSKDTELDYIKPYISAYDKEEQENKRIIGAYGPKIFGLINGEQSQFDRVVNQILKRKETKQAYLSISETDDYKLREEKFSSPPCTIGLHFFVRDNKLNLTVYMRSNDAYYGLPHDLFCFTMLQELVSVKVNIPLGIYTHNATSMHIYEEHNQQIEKYLEEGLHEPIEMPLLMDVSENMLDLVSKEFDLSEEISKLSKMDNYWKDYSLFSSKHNFNEEFNPETWINMFSNDKMKLIAKNSLGK